MKHWMTWCAGLCLGCVLVPRLSDGAAKFALDIPAIPETEAIAVPMDFPLPTVPGLETGGNYQARSSAEPSGVTPLQISSLGPWKGRWGLWACFILDRSRRGKAASQRLSIEPSRNDNPAAFRFEKADDKYLHLFEEDKAVLTYNYGMLLKEGVPEDRRRSCYIHPVYGLDGEILTDDFPADHLHHRGLCWVWPRVIIDDKECDLWDLRGIGQKFERWLGQEVGPVCAVFGAANGWYVGDEKIINETVWVRVFRAGVKGRAIDVELTLNATKQPVKISGRPPVKGYGGFSFRFAPREETVLTSPAGKEAEDSNLKPYPWADLSARFAGRDTFSGVAIFDDAKNPGFPNGWTLRNYGFLGAAWPGLEMYTLKPGKPLTLRYRLWVHRGDAKQGSVAEASAAYGSKDSK